MNKYLKQEGEYHYIETTPGKEVILLLHGLFGALSNFEDIINDFKDDYNVVVPILPIMEMPMKKLGLSGLVAYIGRFVEFKSIDEVNVLGNSLGGHLAQLYALSNPEKVKSIILTGSSGLFENAMGNTFPKRGDYEFIKKATSLLLSAAAEKPKVWYFDSAAGICSSSVRGISSYKAVTRCPAPSSPASF